MDQITINGKIYKKEEIEKKEFYNSSILNDAEKSVLNFLTLWYDDSLFIEVKTSGSTGEPKPIELPKSSMLASARATIEYFSLLPQSDILLAMSPDYIAGKMMILRALAGNLNLWVIDPVSNISPFLDRKYEFCALVPYQVFMTLKDARASESFNKINQLIIGGGKVDDELKSMLLNTGVKCYSTYGMTETASHVAIKKIGEDDVFESLPGVTFSIDDRNCLIIKTSYLPEKEIITNDVVTLIDDTRFVWNGRFDNVINSGGVKLFPEMIEEKIKDIISHNFFIAKEDHHALGQIPVLVIESSPIGEEQEIKLLDKISKRVKKYENPKKIVYINQIEKTPTGKIKRQY